MSVKKYLGSVLLLFAIGFIISCQKTNNGIPAITNPLVVLTPSSDSGYASDQIAIDYSCTGAKGIKKIEIYTQYLSNPKIEAKDSTLPATVPEIDLNFDYTIPATAVRGQQTVITFIITDGSGDSTTKIATITVTGSRPSITVTPNSTNASRGDSVSFNVFMQSPDKYIQTLDISQITTTGTDSSIAGFPYSGNKVVSTTYKYSVPQNAISGTSIALLFTVVNSSGITNFANATIKVN